jgi:hypothetical protein
MYLKKYKLQSFTEIIIYYSLVEFSKYSLVWSIDTIRIPEIEIQKWSLINFCNHKNTGIKGSTW